MDIMDNMDIMDRDRIRGTGTKPGYFFPVAKQPQNQNGAKRANSLKFVKIRVIRGPLFYLPFFVGSSIPDFAGFRIQDQAQFG